VTDIAQASSSRPSASDKDTSRAQTVVVVARSQSSALMQGSDYVFYTETAGARSQISPLIEYISVFLMVIACLMIMLTTYSLISSQLKLSTDPADIYYESLIYTANEHHYGMISLYFLIWLISMGCIGAIASIGMNAIKAQNDLTFDISDGRSTTLRVVLGGLFALVLILPFGNDCFIDYCYFIGTGSTLQHFDGRVEETLNIRVLTLIAPFLIGYSTSLVIFILDRLMVRAKGLFGAAQDPAPTGRQQSEGTTSDNRSRRNPNDEASQSSK
jgi:hypothetical protein